MYVDDPRVPGKTNTDALKKIPAAKDTWALMKDRGIDALINDNLTGISGSISPLFLDQLDRKIKD